MTGYERLSRNKNVTARFGYANRQSRRAKAKEFMRRDRIDNSDAGYHSSLIRGTNIALSNPAGKNLGVRHEKPRPWYSVRLLNERG
jgi:hypothetical protein